MLWPKTSPLLTQAFDLLQVDATPFVDWLRRERPAKWVRREDLKFLLPSTPEIEIVALSFRDGVCDIEIKTPWSRMISDGHVVSIIAEARPDVLAQAMVGKALVTFASPAVLRDDNNVVLKATTYEKQLLLLVRAPAVPFKNV